MIGVYHGTCEHKQTHKHGPKRHCSHMSGLDSARHFYVGSVHADISHLIQLKHLNNLIGNNWLQKFNYINKTVLTDYVEY